MHRETEQINKIFHEIAMRDGIRELKLSHEGTAALKLKSGVKVFFEYIQATNKLYVYTPLSPIPKEDGRRQALYETMLSCNFLNFGCEKGGLAIFMRTQEAVYQIGLNVENLKTAQLDRALMELVKRREEALHKMQKLEAASQASVQSANSRATTASRLNMMTSRVGSESRS